VVGHRRPADLVLLAARAALASQVNMLRVLCLALVVAPLPALASDPVDAPVWMTDGRGRRFRSRFDPGERLFAGAGAVGVATTGSSRFEGTAEVGLSLRAPPPDPEAPVFWKRDHQITHLRLRRGGDGVALDGRLYQAILLRHSREGSLTIPTTPPLRLTLPFDVGVRVELGRLSGNLPLSATGTALEAGVVRGEALADFLRSEHPGRWLAVGAVGYYDVRLERRAGGRLGRDHQVMPLTAGCLWLHGESARGLVSGGVHAELGRAWSSQRGWGPALRVEGEVEVTPVAVNDLPVSLVLSATMESGRNTPDDRARFRTFAGVRLGAPLRGD
jgi:hypothetical protein